MFAAEEAMKEIRDILYPKGDEDAEWSSDELPWVAEVVNRYFAEQEVAT